MFDHLDNRATREDVSEVAGLLGVCDRNRAQQIRDLHRDHRDLHSRFESLNRALWLLVGLAAFQMLINHVL